MGSASTFHPTRNWFERLPAQGPTLRLYCFPYAGAGADVYRSWQQWFPQKVQICLVHLPGRGRGMGEQPFAQLPPLVASIADRIDREPRHTYALYGHSMGALIAFELGREMFRRHGYGPEHLLVSGRRAPQSPTDEPVIFNLPHDQFLAELRRLNGTPAEVLDNPEVIELFITTLRADFELVDTYEYRPGEPLSCPITVYNGIKDIHVPTESSPAWQEQTSSHCKVRLLNGDHFFIRNPDQEFISAFKADVLSAVPDLRENAK
ncbi:MAG: alpha/beta fold hydrolase [Candidatus Angelobacter sp.]